MSKSTGMAKSEAAAIAECIVNTLSSAMFILDSTFRIVTANASFYRTFYQQPGSITGQLLFEICDKKWNTAELRSILTSIIQCETAARKYTLQYTFDTLTIKQLRMNICLLEQMPGNPPLVLVYIYDVAHPDSDAHSGSAH